MHQQLARSVQDLSEFEPADSYPSFQFDLTALPGQRQLAEGVYPFGPFLDRFMVRRGLFHERRNILRQKVEIILKLHVMGRDRFGITQSLLANSCDDGGCVRSDQLDGNLSGSRCQGVA